ncbi:peptidase M24, structural domain-containing protein [Umbelopsis sp. PMI_123]|nr:peptidase M24, structural domain-containing protein [Umbelopsis sp. PMI_123]
MPPHATSFPSVGPSKLSIKTKQHCLNVKQLMSQESGIIYLRGALNGLRDDTDVEIKFRQESNFFYLTGVNEPEFQFVFDFASHVSYLIAPYIPEAERMWKGEPDTVEEMLQKYDVDQIIYEDDLSRLIKAINPQTVFVLDTTDITPIANVVPADKIDISLLKPAMYESRLLKFPWEIQLIRKVTHLSSHAHITLMREVQFGKNESELQALFEWECARNGAGHQSYLPIVASGKHAATLHYTHNNKWLNRKENPDMLLLVDAGGEKNCYGTDITRTYPVSGKFSPEAKTIYNIVLKMQQAVLDRLRPGTLWTDMQNLVIRILCEELIRIGILIGEQDEILKLGLTRAFYFHGLGHSVGLDVHDVGGRKAGVFNCLGDEEDNIARSHFLLDRPLEANMIITVEPGLYFNNVSLNAWTTFPGLQKYFNIELLQKYRKVGGVRIEDTVLITENGYENLTIAPKTVDDIEALMAATHPLC